MAVTIGETPVWGVELDPQGRCRHWHGPSDVLAIQFPCCGRYFACRACHEETAGHPAEVWSRSQFDEPALLCGACGGTQRIRDYLAASASCPHCGAAFNLGCRSHWHLYFEQTPF